MVRRVNLPVSVDTISHVSTHNINYDTKAKLSHIIYINLILGDTVA